MNYGKIRWPFLVLNFQTNEPRSHVHVKRSVVKLLEFHREAGKIQYVFVLQQIPLEDFLIFCTTT